MANPLQQFEIKKLVPIEAFGFDISITNSTLWMFIAIAFTTGFLLLGSRKKELVPGKTQSLVEVIYNFIAGTFKDNISHGGEKYFPFIFTIFMFVLACNLMGMVPFSFTVTSHVAVTFAVALTLILMVIVIGIVKQGGGFFRLFLPPDIPWAIKPIIIMAEVASFLSRPISLSVRLAANMTAGHVLLKVLAGFITPMGYIGGILPILFVTFMTGFEFLIAILHAYIFTLLTCIYLNDALEGH